MNNLQTEFLHYIGSILHCDTTVLTHLISVTNKNATEIVGRMLNGVTIIRTLTKEHSDTLKAKSRKGGGRAKKQKLKDFSIFESLTNLQQIEMQIELYKSILPKFLKFITDHRTLIRLNVKISKLGCTPDWPDFIIDSILKINEVYQGNIDITTNRTENPVIWDGPRLHINLESNKITSNIPKLLNAQLRNVETIVVDSENYSVGLKLFDREAFPAHSNLKTMQFNSFEGITAEIIQHTQGNISILPLGNIIFTPLNYREAELVCDTISNATLIGDTYILPFTIGEAELIVQKVKRIKCIGIAYTDMMTHINLDHIDVEHIVVFRVMPNQTGIREFPAPRYSIYGKM